MIDGVEMDVVKVTVGNGTYMCEKSGEEVLDLSADIKTAKLVCPIRLDVFCNNPQKGVKLPKSDDSSSRVVWYVVGGAAALLVVGGVAFLIFNSGKKEALHN